MTTREYYNYRVHLGGRTHYVLWYGDAHDGVVFDQHGDLAAFASRAALTAYAAAHGLAPLLDAAASLDLEAVVRWCEHPKANHVECHLLLDAWNFFTDVAASVPDKASAFVGGFARYTPVYDKLFFGCNLPAITPDGQHYTPSWTDEGLTDLVAVLRSGLDDVRARFPERAAEQSVAPERAQPS